MDTHQAADRITDLNTRLAGTEQRLDTRITELGTSLGKRLDAQDLAHLSLVTDVAVIKAAVTNDAALVEAQRERKHVAWEVQAILAAAIIGPIATLLATRIH